MTKKTTEVKKQKFLAALLISNSIKEAYTQANISRATATRYLKDENFKQKYHDLQQRIMEFAGNKIRSAAGRAVDTLAAILDDPEATPADKTRAAKIILDSAFHVQETEDIIQRIKKLESEVNG